MEIVNKAVLVTGADGFIGSHLTEALVCAGARVKALSLYNSFNNWGWLEDINCLDQVEVVCGDIRDPHFVSEITEGIEVIFHLAALIAIPYSYVAPESYVATNIIGTLNLLHAAREAGIKRFLHTSTSEVYGTARFVPIREDHPLQAQSPYSATKIGADALAYSYYSTYGLPVTIVRPFNTYGPRQSSRAIIPTVMTQILSGKQVIRIGSLQPTRDFNYVEDTCRGFLKLAERDNIEGETINIGSNREISMGDLVNLIQEVLGTKVTVETDKQRVRPKDSEVERLLCDNSKIRALTGFEPQVPLREGLERTAAWLRQSENLKKYKANIYNV